MVKKGQIVTRIVETLEDACSICTKPKTMRGEVIYVHPKGRFHTVKFANALGQEMKVTYEGVG